MMEIKLCSVCGRIKTDAKGCGVDHSRELEVLRACADCEFYAEAATMVTQMDGRTVCPKCQGRIARARAKRAQLAFFGQMDLI